ncbi:MAG TPA: hypothetical protein GX717_02540 [Clostridiaceae bacterium]|nr:hypothetical protein [Clostridiaceae bacterium]
MDNQYIPLPRLLLTGMDKDDGHNLVLQALSGVFVKARRRVTTWIAGSDNRQAGLYEHITGRTTRSLDSWILDDRTLGYLLHRNSADGSLSLFHAPNGHYAGWLAEPTELPLGSAAELAEKLDLPTIVVIDGSRLSNSIIPRLNGMQQMAGAGRIKGFIICYSNQERYEKWAPIIAAGTHLTGLGFLNVPRDNPKRPIHLIMPPGENWALTTRNWVQMFNDQVTHLAALAAQDIKIDTLIAIAESAKSLVITPPAGFMQTMATLSRLTPFRLGIPMDAAFHIYDPDNLDLLTDMGAEIVQFSPLRDRQLPPDLDGLYFGGGHPELLARDLHANVSLRDMIVHMINDGMPVLAESEGIYYFAQRIESAGGAGMFPMLGLIPGDGIARYQDKSPRYCRLTAEQGGLLGPRGMEIKASLPQRLKLTQAGRSFRIKDQRGTVYRDIFMSKTVCFSQPALRFYSNVDMAEHFVRACSAYADERQTRGPSINAWSF